MLDFLVDVIIAFLPLRVFLAIVAVLVVGGFLLLSVLSHAPDKPAKPSAPPVTQAR